MSDNVLYKIRRKSDGLFSTGGHTPRFTKIGKSWKFGALLNHLTMIRTARIRRVEGFRHYRDNKPVPNAAKIFAQIPDIYEDCEIITFKIVVDSTIPIGDFKYSTGKTVNEVAEIEESEMLERCRTGNYVRSSRGKITGKE